MVPVGVLASGAVELPERPTVLGWYAAGAVPGDSAGTAVIAVGCFMSCCSLLDRTGVGHGSPLRGSP
jgi:hypothetical protein